MFAAAIAAAAHETPMCNGSVALRPGRLLLADGDGLAYYCAGSDDTEPAQARINLIEKLRSAARSCGAETVKVVCTGAGSHKGYRYAVARVKPYQGQRSDSRKPRNWAFLRELLMTGLPGEFEVEHTDTAEADDLFSRYAANHPDCVIYTQDKDMRMVEGWHLDWLTHLLHEVRPGEFAKTWGEKTWGRKWFWLQMLQGDTADNIPGLPFYVDGKGSKKKIGEKTAATLLAGNVSDMGALLSVQSLYRSCYAERWLVEMLEQAILLWMRTDQTSSPLNVCAPGNPLAVLATHIDFPAAKAEIMARIAQAMVHDETQDDAGGDDPTDDPGQPGTDVRAVPSDLPGEQRGPGPRPLDGCDSRDPAPGMQQPPREDREQLQEVRSAQPVGFRQWGRFLLAAPRD